MDQLFNMKTGFGDIELTLANLLALSVRGPKRNAIFAILLFLRVCGSTLDGRASADRNRRKRLQNLEHRVRSLSMPAAIRKAIRNSIKHLQEHSHDDVSGAMELLLAPAQETLGPNAATAIANACRLATNREARISKETA